MGKQPPCSPENRCESCKAHDEWGRDPYFLARLDQVNAEIRKMFEKNGGLNTVMPYEFSVERDDDGLVTLVAHETEGDSEYPITRAQARQLAFDLGYQLAAYQPDTSVPEPIEAAAQAMFLADGFSVRSWGYSGCADRYRRRARIAADVIGGSDE